MFKRKCNSAFSKGYAFFKLLIGFGWWYWAIELFNGDNWLGALACGIIAIGFIMEAIRLIKKKYWRK